MMPFSYLSPKTEVRESIMGGSGGKPGRCFASVTAPKTMSESRRRRMYPAAKSHISPTRSEQRVPPWVTCAMMQFSYLSPKTEIRESRIHGCGLFAIADVAKDEIVAVKGGHI